MRRKCLSWMRLAVNEVFNLKPASLAHAGQDAGCISGTSDCAPSTDPHASPVPEPATMTLFSLGFSASPRVAGGNADEPDNVVANWHEKGRKVRPFLPF